MLNFNGAWRFSSPGPISHGVVRDFRGFIEKIAAQGDARQVVERFKAAFSNDMGRSSDLSWAWTDLDTSMRSAADNAPAFIDAFFSCCADLERSGLAVPNVNLINSVLAKHNAGYEIRLPDLVATHASAPVAPVPAVTASPPSKASIDFFISYTHADKAWAEWIGYVLEEEGFSVVVQAWDFRPGSNFVLAMQEAAETAKRTLMVLSPDYLKSQFASPEWAAAFGQDPQGRELKLVPVMVRSCQPLGLLTTIVQIRIVGMDEGSARKALIDGINQKRAKPSVRPPFPGAVVHVPHKEFPGPSPDAAKPSFSRQATRLIPPLKLAPTDMDKRRFAREGFNTIKAAFEANLQAVSQHESRIEFDFQLTTATDFRAELFLDGKSACIARIWMGGMHSDDNICFSEGRQISPDSCNEILSLSQGNELQFHALMAMGMFAEERNFDMKRLSADQAADYLWRRFVSPLGRQ